MKKIILAGVVAMSLLASCENKQKEEEAAQAQAMAEATRAELEAAITERDQLLDLMNEISSGMDEIKSIESIVAVNVSGETSGNRAKVTNDIAAIKATLEQRRQKLDELERQLKNSKLSNSKLLASIESMKSQLATQASEIESLTDRLRVANEKIAVLDQQVDSLNTAVATVTDERNEAQEEAVRQANLANVCYYAIGSKSELKSHNIIEGGGFLRKTRIMQGDFDKGFFTQADKRTLMSIPLHSKKAKLLNANHPVGSYVLEDVGGQMVLKITNPAEFWGQTNYLVIQID